MTAVRRAAYWTTVAVIATPALWAQELAPRAYVVTPVDSNAVTLSYSFYDGSIDFDGSAPITGASGTYSVEAFTYYHAINFFGRSANMTGTLPYAIGTFQGTVQEQYMQIYRSGLADTSFRFAVNLKGGAAMHVPQYLQWKQKTLLGASLKVVAPTGQYSPYKLINWGGNRWAFKPEFGYSERWKDWVLDGYAGVWFYTENAQSYAPPSVAPKTLTPVGVFEGHLSYDVKPRFWFSLDGDYWFGGTASLNNVENPATRQASSKIGGTGSVPIGKHQSIKVSYANVAYAKFGGSYQELSAGWQYSWIGRP